MSQPITHGRVAPARRVGVIALVATLAAFASSSLGALVAHFNISWQLASFLITTVASGAMWTISAFYPWLLPVILTVRTLIITAGTGAAIGW